MRKPGRSSSSTTSSVSLKPVPKCPRCSVVHLQRWVTSQHFPRKWVTCRSGLLRQRRFHYSFQAVYVPADDLTDPAPANTFAHLDSTIVLERSIAELGIYPAVDPLASISNALDPAVVGKEHYEVARGVQSVLQRYNDLQDIIAILGLTNFPPRISKPFTVHVRYRSLSQPFYGGSLHRNLSVRSFGHDQGLQDDS